MPAKKSGRTTTNARSNGENAVFYVKELPDVDTTQWIAHDVPVDLERLMAESKQKP